MSMISEEIQGQDTPKVKKKLSLSFKQFEALRKGHKQLQEENEKLKQKLNELKKPPSPLTQAEIDREAKEKEALFKAANQLESILQDVKFKSSRLEIFSTNTEISDVISSLTKKIEEEQLKCEKIMEALRKERDNDEKFILKDKLGEVKLINHDLEVANAKLKVDNERLTGDLVDLRKTLLKVEEQLRGSKIKIKDVEEERDRLKRQLDDVENDNLRLKKEMIQELNEANRARRVSIDTEIALQHVSDAFENKRQEVIKLQKDLEWTTQLLKQYQKPEKD